VAFLGIFFQKQVYFA